MEVALSLLIALDPFLYQLSAKGREKIFSRIHHDPLSGKLINQT